MQTDARIYNQSNRGDSKGGTLLATQTYDMFDRPKHLSMQENLKKSQSSNRNANRIYKTQLHAKRKSINNGNQDVQIDQINNLLSQQHNKLRILEDKITKNVLLFTPKEIEQNNTKPKPVSEAIRRLDQQIIQCQKTIERELKARLFKEYQEQQQQLNPTEQKFEEDKKQQQSYDFLTNPQIAGYQQNIPEEQQKEEEEKAPEIKEKEDKSQQVNDTYKNFHKMQRHYEKELDKLYIKRENPGIYSKIKPKNPKIYITGKTNKIQKFGEPFDYIEHKMRVFNRENTPCIPELIIPSFPTKKDQMAQSILAYLKEYSPLVRGDNSHEFPKCIKNILQDELAAIHQRKIQINENQSNIQGQVRLQSLKRETLTQTQEEESVL